MSETSTSGAMKSIIRRMERRLEIVRQMQQLIEEDPSLLDELQAALVTSPGGNGNQAGPRPGTATDKVISLFRERGNGWLTTAEIIKGSGVSRGTLAPILHSHDSSLFEKRNHPDSKKLKQWRLRQEVPHV
jgi:hypothetical protein